MKIRLNNSKEKELVIGNMYIIQYGSVHGYYSIGIYLGKDIRKYFCFYNVLNLRYGLDDTNFSYYNRIGLDVEIGSNELIECYKEIITASIKNYNEDSLVFFSTLTNKVFNSICLGIDTNDFVDLYRLDAKVGKLVTKKNLKKNTLYVSTTLGYCLKLRDEFFVKPNDDFLFYKYFFYGGDWYANKPEYQGVQKSKIKYYTLPKMIELDDVLKDKNLCKKFERANQNLYNWCLAIKKGNNIQAI